MATIATLALALGLAAPGDDAFMRAWAARNQRLEAAEVTLWGCLAASWWIPAAAPWVVTGID